MRRELLKILVLAILVAAPTPARAQAKSAQPPETRNAALRYWMAFADMQDPPAAKNIADVRALFSDAEAATHLSTAQASERMLAIQARVSTLHPYFRETTPTLTKVNDARTEVEASRQKLLKALGKS